MTTAGGYDFAGQLAVVTGGGSGIGAAIAQSLAGRGADVVVADRDESAASRVAEAIGGKAHQVDVTDRNQVRAMFTGLAQPPRVLVTCAGGARRTPALEVDEELFAETINLNAGGFWRCTQEAAQRCLEACTGLSVVHIASSLHRGPAPELSHFAAAKAASITLVRCLAQELAPYGVRVNGVIPGPVETPTTTPIWDAQPQLREALKNKLPLARIGDPVDIAPAVIWLASDEAAWVTGSILTVDGGLGVSAT